VNEFIVDRPSRQTASDQAEAVLIDAMMEGKIPPGSALRLQELASQLGMSVMPVREAIRRLDALGLVEIVPHKGAWVRPLTLEDLYDTYFTRLHLECTAMRAAASRFGDADVRAAREALEAHMAARVAHDSIRARDTHERFHFAMYGACGSTWLMRSIALAWRNSERYRVESMRHPAHVRKRAQEHVAMLEALTANDGERAVGLLIDHLKTSVELVARGLEDDGGQPRLELPTVEELMAGPVRYPGEESARR
jgi:DNA-binding GntR family transcriptional regulator